LAEKAGFPQEETLDLAKVAQYYHIMIGRLDLHKDLHKIFDKPFHPASLHEFLAALPGPLLIVTTNYDDLIEKAFDKEGREYDLVIHTTAPTYGERILWRQHGMSDPQSVMPNKVNIDLKFVTVIYKMHGAMDRDQPKRDQYVITEDDYIDFLARMTKNKAIPAIFAEPFENRHFLFLGYGLRDWNLRVVLSRIAKKRQRSDDIESWAIQCKPSRLEQRLWVKRGVDVFDMTIEAFVNKLKSL
jgi:hypothetical protein